MLKTALIAAVLSIAGNAAAGVTAGQEGPGSTDYPRRSLVEMGTVDFPKPEDGFTAMSYDERRGHVYTLHYDGTLSVVKFAAGPTDRTLRRIGSVAVGTEPSKSIIADPNNEFSLLVTATEVVKIRHEDGNTVPRVVGRTALLADESRLSPGIFDREGRFAYFSSVGGPLYLVQIDAGTGDDPPRRITRLSFANARGGIDSIATDPNRRLAFMVADLSSGETTNVRLVTARLASPTAPMAFVANVSLPAVQSPQSLSYHLAGANSTLLVFSPEPMAQIVRHFDVAIPQMPIFLDAQEIDPDPERLVPLPRGQDTHARFAAVAGDTTFLLRIRPRVPSSSSAEVVTGPPIANFGAAVGGSVVFGDSDFILLGDERAGGDLVRLSYTLPANLSVIATGNGVQRAERLAGLALDPADGRLTVGAGSADATASGIHQIAPNAAGPTWRGSAGTGAGTPIALYRDPSSGDFAHVIATGTNTLVARAPADATAGAPVLFTEVTGVPLASAFDEARRAVYIVRYTGTDELAAGRVLLSLVNSMEHPVGRSVGAAPEGPYLAAVGAETGFFAAHATENRIRMLRLETGEQIREFSGPAEDGAPRLGFIDTDRNQLLTVHTPDAVRIVRWRLEGENAPARIDATEIPGIDSVRAVSWDSDSRTVLLAGADASGSVAVRMTLPAEGPPAPGPATPFGDAAGQTNALLLDADRDVLWATQGDSGSAASLRRFDTGRIDGAVWGTRVSIGSPVAVDELRFYSHRAGANVRLAVYDNADPRALLWESPAIATAAGAPVVAPIAAGTTTTTLRLAPGTYWLAWQIDRDLDAPAYFRGGDATGFRIEQPFGAMPASISDKAQPTPDNWSISLRGEETNDAVLWMMR
jgi:hypothetical protein